MDNIHSLNLQIETIKAVIFDMDGVLVNTSSCHEQAYQSLWLKWGIAGPEYSKIAGRSTREVVAEYCAALSAEEQKNCVNFKQSIALELQKSADIIFEDTFKVLCDLVNKDVRLALATSASLASAELVIDRLHARGQFECVVTSDDVDKAKPAPDLFLKAINELQLQSTQTIIIEDSVAGIKAALAAGSWVVSVREYQADLEHARYVGHFNNLNDMYQCLFREAV